MERLKRFFHEVHRRFLWQALIFYLAFSTAALYVSQQIAERRELPAWFTEFAIILLIFGLPIVLITAAVQEGIPKLGRSDPTLRVDVEALDDPASLKVQPERGHWRSFTWRNAMLGGFIAFTIWAIVALGWLLLANRLVTDAQRSTAEQPVVGGEQ